MRLLILLFPWLELWTLIELGARTSALTALAYVFATLVLGIAMIRRQGLTLLQQMQRDAEVGFFSPRLLMDDLALVSAGLLFMVPGIITDVMALLVLIGPLRRRLLGLGRWQVHTTHTRTGGPSGDADDPVTLEGEFRRLDD